MTHAEMDVYEPVRETPTLWGTDDPAAVVQAATKAAQPLADVVEKQKLFTLIQGRKHVRVEGWTLLGSMLGVFPVTVWSRKTETGWEARVEARTRHGDVVGAAEAQCDRTEKTWAARDDYALRSMAQTRATSKALRQPLGFVMTLAGFDATPADEMPVIEASAVAGSPFHGDTYEPAPAESQFQPPAAAAAKTGDAASEAQRKNMFRLVKKIGEQNPEYTEETFKAELMLAYGVDSTSGLTKKEASQVIDLMKKRAGEET